VPTTADKWILTDILRGEMGFNGYVMSDFGAIERLGPDTHAVRTLVAPTLFVNSDAVLLCSILLHSVLLTSPHAYVAPTPFVNSDVVVNNALC
jgi:beta-glucosidase-like glycosyl hydrolase